MFLYALGDVDPDVFLHDLAQNVAEADLPEIFHGSCSVQCDLLDLSSP